MKVYSRIVNVIDINDHLWWYGKKLSAWLYFLLLLLQSWKLPYYSKHRCFWANMQFDGRAYFHQFPDNIIHRWIYILHMIAFNLSIIIHYAKSKAYGNIVFTAVVASFSLDLHLPKWGRKNQCIIHFLTAINWTDRSGSKRALRV